MQIADLKDGLNIRKGFREFHIIEILYWLLSERIHLL
jgi:hypothetical protein